MDYNTVNQGKTIAIISYITFIGTVIAFIMNQEKRNAFAAFHIRQALGISLFSFINTLLIARYLDGFSVAAIGIGLFALRIIGFFGAFQGETRKIPLFADIFQDWFKRIV